MKCKGETTGGKKGDPGEWREGADGVENRGYAVGTHHRQGESGRERSFCIIVERGSRIAPSRLEVVRVSRLMRLFRRIDRELKIIDAARPAATRNASGCLVPRPYRGVAILKT